MKDWKDKITKIIENGCSDSDIEDYITEHPNIKGKDVWNFIYEYDAPTQCHGCKYIQFRGMHPCTSCSRRVLKDYYEAR